jgi:uncharacterized protein with GYD domain
MKGDIIMAKYISLVKYTTKGIENIKESPNRLDAFKSLCESMGATLDGFYLTMGQYDIVTIVDAPNPETVAKLLLTTTSGGAISSETLPAFTEAEYRKVISELP